jgi:glycosyltransferase involved in cell wall biosynthesis
MKLGFVIYGSLDTLSGGYLYDRKLVEYLRSQGDTVEIISLPWRNYLSHLADNFHFRLPRGAVGRVATSQASGVSRPGRVVRLSTHQQFDLLIQDELNHPSLILANRGQHPYPVVSLVHHLRCSELRPDWQNAIYRLIERQYLRSVDGFIFNSRTTEREVQRLLENIKPSVIAYPPTDRFGEPIAEEEIIRRAHSHPLRIVFLGNVIRRKGLHTLLQAVSDQRSAISDQRLAFRVDVIGSLTSDPAYVKQIQELIQRNNLSSFVSLHGSLDKEPLIEKLGQAHVLVVPSSYEGFGIVYLEGMGFGLPAIGTTAGAANEVIRDGVDGFLIGAEDVDSLASRLRILNEERELLIRLSLAARERYLRQPNWEENAHHTREFLQSLLGTID